VLVFFWIVVYVTHLRAARCYKLVFFFFKSFLVFYFERMLLLSDIWGILWLSEKKLFFSLVTYLNLCAAWFFSFKICYLFPYFSFIVNSNRQHEVRGIVGFYFPGIPKEMPQGMYQTCNLGDMSNLVQACQIKGNSCRRRFNLYNQVSESQILWCTHFPHILLDILLCKNELCSFTLWTLLQGMKTCSYYLHYDCSFG